MFSKFSDKWLQSWRKCSGIEAMSCFWWCQLEIFARFLHCKISNFSFESNKYVVERYFQILCFLSYFHSVILASIDDSCLQYLWLECSPHGKFLSSLLQLQLQFSFSSVSQSCPTLCDSMDYSMPGFPVHLQSPLPPPAFSNCNPSTRNRYPFYPIYLFIHLFI